MKHTSWTLKLSQHQIIYSFDTFITPEGNDRFIKNTIRAIATILLVSTGILWPTYYSIIPMIPGILLIGVHEVYYYRNNKQLALDFWK